MILSVPIKRMFLSLFVIASFYFGVPANANDLQTQTENKAFKEAVEAIKDKNYAHAITLFEAQAKMPRHDCLLYTSPSPRDATLSRMPSSA